MKFVDRRIVEPDVNLPNNTVAFPTDQYNKLKCDNTDVYLVRYPTISLHSLAKLSDVSAIELLNATDRCKMSVDLYSKFGFDIGGGDVVTIIGIDSCKPSDSIDPPKIEFNPDEPFIAWNAGSSTPLDYCISIAKEYANLKELKQDVISGYAEYGFSVLEDELILQEPNKWYKEVPYYDKRIKAYRTSLLVKPYECISDKKGYVRLFGRPYNVDLHCRDIIIGTTIDGLRLK